MRELHAGLWHWEAPHPTWTPAERWPQVVSSYAIGDGARLLLFDPLAVPSEILELAADREPVVVLTAPWHERDTKSLVERLGMPVFVPPPDTGDDFVIEALVDFGRGLEINEWLRGGVTREEVVARLRAPARTAGRGRAPGPRSTDRPCCARARALLTAVAVRDALVAERDALVDQCPSRSLDAAPAGTLVDFATLWRATQLRAISSTPCAGPRCGYHRRVAPPAVAASLSIPTSGCRPTPRWPARRLTWSSHLGRVQSPRWH